MFKRILAVVLVLMLALSIAPLAGAQDAGCFNLSAEDCEIINGASMNTRTITSFNQDFSINFTVSGLEVLAMLAPELPSALEFSVAGSGPLVVNPGNAENPIELGLDMVVNAFDGTNALENVELPFIITDGVVYTLGNGEIIGIPVENADDAELPLVGGIDTDMTLNNIGDLLGDDFDGLLNPSGTDLGSFGDALNYVRLADESMMGQTMYPFQFLIDVDAVLNSPEILGVLNQAGGLLGDGAEADPMTAMALQLIPTLLAGVESDVMVTQYVGADDNFIHRLTFDLNFAIDLGVLAGGAAGGAGSGAQIPPLAVDLTFDVSLSDINSSFDVVAPEGARILSEEEVNDLFGSGLELLPDVGF